MAAAERETKKGEKPMKRKQRKNPRAGMGTSGEKKKGRKSKHVSFLMDDGQGS